MPTFKDLQNAVQSDLRRSDLAEETATAINAAIRDYAAQRFWFNDTRKITFSTVTGQEFYEKLANPALPNLVRIDSLIVSDGIGSYPAERVNNDDIETMMSQQGWPSYYAYVDSSIRLFPVPSRVYQIRVTGYARPDPLTHDTDTNNFTENAFDLIRYAAARRVFTSPVRNADQAGAMAMLEQEQLSRMRSETVLRLGSGQIVPTSF